MGRGKPTQQLFNPFKQMTMSKRDTWETEYAPSSTAPVPQAVVVDRASDTGSSKSRFHHSPTLRALERDRTGGSNVSSLSSLSSLSNASSVSNLSSYPPGISPSDGVIGIGISPSIGGAQPKQAGARQLIPDQATPIGLKSAWSPDTPSTAGSLGPRSSSIYSQMTAPATVSSFFDQSTAPPVPRLPAAYAAKDKGKGRLPETVEENCSPFTLFSGDDDDYEPSSSPPSGKLRLAARENAPSAGSKSRNWEVVVGLGSKHSGQSSPETIDDEWWQHEDGQARPPGFANRFAQDKLHVQRTPIIRVPTPKRAGSPASSMSVSLHAATPVTSQTRVAKEEEVWEEPPPYSPPSHPVHDMPKISTLQVPAPVGGTVHHSTNATNVTNATNITNITNITGISANPPGEARRTSPPSPGPVSPAFAQSLAAPGDVGMSNIPLSPGPTAGAGAGQVRLPDRTFGTFIPAVHAVPTTDRTERKRRRHEKEDYWAHRIGNAWRGRGPFRNNRYFGEPGEKGRKRRRWCCGLILGVAVLVTIASGLAVWLATRHAKGSVTLPDSASPPNDDEPMPPSPTETTSAPTATSTSTTTNIFATATGFPPIPTGVLTVVAPINPINDSSCVDPSTLWSCSLPPEDHASVYPFEASRPTFIMHIQWDRSEDEKWNTTNPDSPTNSTLGPNDDVNNSKRDILFTPSPAPPSLDEMAFLGNTTDGIQGAYLAGEPTPFYISMLDSIDASVGPNSRRKLKMGRRAGVTPGTGNGLPSPNLPAPDLNEDGTGAAAVLFPLARQQPLRLFDRGLATEHYAFYTYFKRTIYVRSAQPTNGTVPVVALDRDGGSRESQAKFLVTWGSVRYRMQLFTALPDSAGGGGSNRTLLPDEGTINGSVDLTMPGTMPLAVSMSLDLHGGVPGAKFVWHHDVKPGSKIDTANPGLIGFDMGSGVVNPAPGDGRLGGVDGGTGGCQCRWTNYRDPVVDGWLREQKSSNADQTVNIPMTRVAV